MKKLVTTALALLMIVIPAGAAASTRDPEREVQIEEELGQKHPELVQVLRAATVAHQLQDYPTAERLLRDLTVKVPDFDTAFRRLGECLVMQSNHAEGRQFCERAVEINASAENLKSLAFTLLRSNPDTQDARRAVRLLNESASKLGTNDLGILLLTAEAFLKLHDRSGFHSANTLLTEKYPDQAVTHYFAAIEAAMNQRWLRAENEIHKAEKLGLPHETAQRFLAGGVHSRAVWSRVVFDVLLVLVLWVVGLALLLGIGFVLSRLTLTRAETADARATITSTEKAIRKVYRLVLNFAGVYYYISLPVIIILVISVVGIIFYAFTIVGRIPIKLMALLALGALVTIIAMIKSLFVRVESSDPGRALQRSEAEELWKLTQEVAESVGTRPIDEIRITPGTELAVYERGTWRQKLRNQAQRILILGTGVLNGFKQNDFRCVLAHEYGHFSNRDTAGGDIALRVRNDMLKFFVAMCEAGQATWMNAAFHFLRVYSFIFRRISHGATRLQEILADRVAAQIYGAPAFESGLTHVIRRSLEFDAAASHEIEQSIAKGRPLQNLYELSAPEVGKVATELDKALNRQTSDDDTHPAPRERFRLVGRLQQPSCPPRPGEVWDLFNDPDAIRNEMVALIEEQVAPNREEAQGAPE